VETEGREGGFPLAGQACISAPLLPASPFPLSQVQVSEGFEWINESTTPRPKWGYVSTTVGAVLKLLVDTRASSTHVKQDVSALEGGRGPRNRALSCRPSA
jgi:hypothetical protein